jgi:hypothetical protein
MTRTRVDAINKLAAVLFVVVVAVSLTACDRIFGKTPSGPTTVQTVTVTVNSPQASPSPSSSSCAPTTSIQLGTQGDDHSLVADGVDSVTLVPSYFAGILEQPPACSASLSPTFQQQGPCVIDGRSVTASSPGTCRIIAFLPGVPPSNERALTVTP